MAKGERVDVIINGKVVRKIKGTTLQEHIEFDAEHARDWTPEYKAWLIRQLSKQEG